MRNLILALGLILSVNTFASDVHTDTFSADVGVKFGKIKCSVLGNLKMKLTGLDSRAGKVAKTWLKASKLNSKCRAAKAIVIDQVQRRNNSFPAKVTVKTIVSYREIYRDLGRNGGHFPYNYATPRFYVECEKLQTKKLTAVLTDLTVNGSAITLKNSRSRILEVTFGHCPRN